MGVRLGKESAFGKYKLAPYAPHVMLKESTSSFKAKLIQFKVNITTISGFLLESGCGGWCVWGD